MIRTLVRWPAFSLICLLSLSNCQEIVQNIPKLVVPMVTPAGGKFSSNPTVAISHIDPEAEIRYTLDGTPPSLTSSLYSTPLVFDYEDTTLKVRAFKTGYSSSDVVTEIFRFTWRRLSDMNHARAFHGTAAIGGVPYVFGGTTAAPEYYDSVAKAWTDFSALGNTRYGGVGAFAAWGGALYAIGGYTNTRVAGVERWNPASPDAWSTMTDLALARQNAAGASAGDYIYTFGGVVTGSLYGTTTILRLEPIVGTWQTMAAVLGSERQWHAACSLGTKIYITGGLTGSSYTQTAKLEIFDTTTGILSSGPDMPGTRYCHAMAAYNDKIYVFGGNGGSGNLTRVDIYDPVAASWTSSPTASPFAYWCLSAVPLADGILVTGGKDASNAAQKTAWVYVPGND